MGPAMPIPNPVLPVASIRAYPIPDPAVTAKRTAIASDHVDFLTIGCCSILFILSMCEAAEPLIMQKPIHTTQPFVSPGAPSGGGAIGRRPETTDARVQLQEATQEFLDPIDARVALSPWTPVAPDPSMPE
jgi:hypothetical protein